MYNTHTILLDPRGLWDLCLNICLEAQFSNNKLYIIIIK